MTDTGPARIYSTSEVASRLGISANTVRRYGLAWEEVQGETLPHLPGMGRLYPADVVEMLEQARDWLNGHPDRDIEEALQQVMGLGAREHLKPAPPVPDNVSTVLKDAVSQAITPLAQELSHMRAQIRALEEGQQALLARLAGLQAARDAERDAGGVRSPESSAPEAGPAEEAPLEGLPSRLIIETRPEADVGAVTKAPMQVENAPGRPDAPDWTFYQTLEPQGQATEPPDEQQAETDPLAGVWLEEEPIEEEVLFEEEPRVPVASGEEEGQGNNSEKEKDKAGFIGWFKRNF